MNFFDAWIKNSKAINNLLPRWDNILIWINNFFQNLQIEHNDNNPRKDLRVILIFLFSYLSVLFGMYADESFSYIQKEEMDRRILETEQQVSQALSELFKEVNIASFSVLNKLHVLWYSLYECVSDLKKNKKKNFFFKKMAQSL